jgi:GT2 family glycosyltransferase
MTSEVLVSAVVVNWNGARHLEQCLPSLLSQSHQPLEIIVVDNASTDDSEEVTRRFEVQWLPLGRNAGLAAALNRGADAAAGEFILFLNNDMRFHPAFVDSMVAVLAEDPDVFSVDALQYDWNGGKQVHLATRLAKSRRGDRLSYPMVPALHVFQESCGVPTAVVTASAANMLVRKSMFCSLGGFDERLPLGYEDMELCWRAWIRGWKSIFAPAAVCWHRVGGSTQSSEQGSRMSFRGIYYGRLLVASKLLPVRYMMATWLVSLAGLAADIGRGRWRRTRDRVEMLRNYAGSLRSIMRERRQMFGSGRNSPTAQLERLLHLRTTSYDEQ